MSKPKKYIGLDVNDSYVEYLEDKITKVKNILSLTGDWAKDQDNGLTDSVICVAAMKDIRRIMNG